MELFLCVLLALLWRTVAQIDHVRLVVKQYNTARASWRYLHVSVRVWEDHVLVKPSEAHPSRLH